MKLDLTDLGALDGKPITFTHPSKRGPSPLDDARGAAHRYAAALRNVRHHVANGGSGRDAANAALVLIDCIARIGDALTGGIAEATACIEDDGADAVAVLGALRESMREMVATLNA
jgi:hypothetical protein